MTELHVVLHPDAHTVLDRLRTKDLNFSPQEDGPFIPENGWRIDRYSRALPPEAPGPPEARGSWEVARQLSEAYEFVDPHLVRAFYDPREPLLGRTMLLEIHFWGLRVYAGVRVEGVDDSTREVQGRQARVWAWNYRTLEDHFEVGQIDYEVWKWLDSGEVEFRIDAFSRPARIDQPVVRLGFKLFGRGRQVRFARHACDRMAALTKAAQRGGSGP
ncbi:MAG: hypothetical protein QOG21_271 [Actinomycetota bacterium]|nr:hypothetical protein [Actinomycetota bacterium]